jgi:hypothetical protein
VVDLLSPEETRTGLVYDAYTRRFTEPRPPEPV